MSELVEDPDLGPLAAGFADALPARVQAIAQLLAAADHSAAARLAHQLKGAAGSYGYPEISELARQLEQQMGRDVAATEQVMVRLTARAAAAQRALTTGAGNLA
jgi:HPt (histidine-containing phosphotransfer) domain-containing protein